MKHMCHAQGQRSIRRRAGAHATLWGCGCVCRCFSVPTAVPVCDDICQRQERIAHYVTHHPAPNVIQQAAVHLNSHAGSSIDTARIYTMMNEALRSLQMEEERIRASGVTDQAVLSKLQRQQANCKVCMQQIQGGSSEDAAAPSVAAPHAQRHALRWSEVFEVDEQFLDATKPSDLRLRDLFNRHTHIAIKSAQGTGKTDGVILVELLRLLKHRPGLRVLWLSNRRAYKDDVKRRCGIFESDMRPLVGTACAFRTYDEFTGSDDGNAQLIDAPRLICSLESLPRLTGLKLTSDGSIHTPHYDLIIMDEVMELHSIFHGGTTNNKRRTVHELLRTLCQSTSRVWAADADLTDATALPFLHDLCGRPFAKLLNTRKTICRRYVHHTKYGAWRKLLIQQLGEGKRVVVVCNTKQEALILADDPDILALQLRSAVLTRDSPPDVYEQFIRTTQRWSELDLLIYSPIISSGLDFSKRHFAMALFFGSDNSVTVRQAFQQLNRVRHVSDNVVHMHLSLHPNRYAGLPVTYAAVEHDINTMVGRMKFDYIMPVVVYGAGRRYEVDSQLDAVSRMRTLLQTDYNHIFIRNQLAINQSHAQFSTLLFQSIVEAGGLVERAMDAPDGDAELNHIAEEKDVQDRHLRAVLAARDIVDDLDYDNTQRRAQHQQLRQDGDIEALEKANIKKLYRIPLEDTITIPSIEGFMELYGSEKSQQQARNMLLASQGGTVKLKEDAVTQLHGSKEFVEHLMTNMGVHSVVEQLLAALGFARASSAASHTATVNAGHGIEERHGENGAMDTEGESTANARVPRNERSAAYVGVCALLSPSCIWSRANVYEFEQVRALSEDGDLRSRLLELLVTHPLLHPWWQRYEKLKRKVTWRVEQCRRTGRYELHIEAALPSAAQNQDSDESDEDSQSQGPSDSDKQAHVQAVVLYRILVAAARAFLKQHFHVHLAGGRTKTPPASMPADQGRPGERHVYLGLDRRHWDQWAQSVFGQPPQNPNPTQWAYDRKKE